MTYHTRAASALFSVQCWWKACEWKGDAGEKWKRAYLHWQIHAACIVTNPQKTFAHNFCLPLDDTWLNSMRLVCMNTLNVCRLNVLCVYKVADCISASLSNCGGNLKLAEHAGKTKNFQHLEAFCQEQQAASPPSTNQKPMHNYHKRLQTVIDLLSSVWFKKNIHVGLFAHL